MEIESVVLKCLFYNYTQNVGNSTFIHSFLVKLQKVSLFEETSSYKGKNWVPLWKISNFLSSVQVHLARRAPRCLSNAFCSVFV